MASKQNESQEPIPLFDFQTEYERHGPVVMAAINNVIQSGQFILGPSVTRLEQTLSHYVQPDPEKPKVHCIGVSDGTTALQLCLMALNIRPGDEIITTPFTWISSAEVIPLVNAKPVFADIDPRTYLIDLDSIAKLITPRTRAVIAVSLFGLMPDFQAIRAVLDQYETKFSIGISLIEDAAQSFGAVRKAEHSCGSRFVSMSTTSFFPTKPLGCYGDGGAVFTADDHLADSVRSLRVHGKSSGQHFSIGLNARLDTLQAAVLLIKFNRFPEAISVRRNAAITYNDLLSRDPRIILPYNPEIYDSDSSTHSVSAVYTIRVLQRDAVLKKLRTRGITCAVYYPTPCHLQPVFAALLEEQLSLPVAEKICDTVLSLPIHGYLTGDIQFRIIEELFNALDELKITCKPDL